MIPEVTLTRKVGDGGSQGEGQDRSMSKDREGLARGYMILLVVVLINWALPELELVLNWIM